MATTPQTKEQRVSEVQVQMRQLSADGEKQVTLDQSGNAASLFGHGRLEPWPREQYPPFFQKKSGFNSPWREWRVSDEITLDTIQL